MPTKFFKIEANTPKATKQTNKSKYIESESDTDSDSDVDAVWIDYDKFCRDDHSWGFMGFRDMGLRGGSPGPQI